jgi:RimJ/RimL family protein N-acetyltransferase
MAASVIETERLVLRRFTPADLDALYEVFADPGARRFYPEMVAREKVLAWIEWNLRNYDETGFGLWAMEPRGESRLIGDCGLTWQEVEGRQELEIGWHLLAADRGKGYATEAARACLAYAFRELAPPLVCSIVRPDNAAPCAVAGRVHQERREFVKSGGPATLFFTERR